MADSLHGATLLVIEGLAAMHAMPQVDAETVAAAAQRLGSRIGERERKELRAELAAEHSAHRRRWEPCLGAADARRAEARLAEAGALRFGLVELAAGRCLGGIPALAAAVLGRLGLAGSGGSPAKLDYALDLLVATVGIAVERLETYRRDELCEDDEIEPPEQGRDETAHEVVAAATRWLAEHPRAGRAALDRFLHAELDAQLAEQRRMIEPLRAAGWTGPASLARMAGASEEAIDGFEAKARLVAALERRPAADRLERLLYDCNVEPALLALTERHAKLPTRARPALAYWLAQGMQRRQALIERIWSYGDGSRYAALVAGMWLDVGDFDRAEGALRSVDAEIAGGLRFLTREQREEAIAARSPFRVRMIGARIDLDHRAARRRWVSEQAGGDPVRLARGRAAFAVGLMWDARREDDRDALVDEAIELWQQAMLTWTRERHPRKWAALTHNVGVARAFLASFGPQPTEGYAAALDDFDRALAALDRDAEPWCHAGILSNRLLVAARMAGAGPD